MPGRRIGSGIGNRCRISAKSRTVNRRLRRLAKPTGRAGPCSASMRLCGAHLTMRSSQEVSGVSLLSQLVDSPALKISRSPDFDHFRSIERLGEARSIPLDCRGFAASFAEVTLKSCAIFLQQTFPRILQAQYCSEGALVGLTMDDTSTVILNGLDARPPSEIGRASCRERV